MIVAESVAQEQEDHEHDQRDREQQRELHVVDRLANRLRAVDQDRRASPRRAAAARKRGQQRLDGVDDLDRVGARLALDRQHDGAVLAV